MSRIGRRMPQEPLINSGPVQPVQTQTGVVTLLFTDIVSSTALKQRLGDKAGAVLIQQQRALVRQFLRIYPGAEEIETAGDSFLLSFSKPSDAVRFALVLQHRLRGLNREEKAPLQERIGIHLGEVVIEQHAVGHKPKDLYGLQIDTCARVMSLAKGGQVLMSRGVFDNARQVLKGEDIEGVGQLEWLNHGPYLLKGIEEPVEICEVREAGKEQAPGPPTSSEKAQRQVRADEEQVLGWRPAVGQAVPNTRWELEKKLGEGGFGEVWLARNTTTKQARVFKFCFQAERVRFLKREMTLFRLLKERIGDHPNIVRLNDVYLEQPPFYVEMEYVAGEDLRSWCKQHGDINAIPLETRLEIVAQAAEGLQAAHDAGIIHRDVKPGNILVASKTLSPPLSPSADEGSLSAGGQLLGQSLRPNAADLVSVKLTDFGIGQVVSEEYLQGITRAGFTHTMVGSGSSQTGTQLYMAPEVLSGTAASIRSDIYSLGVVLYQLLVGDFARPVTGDWAEDIRDMLLREDLKHCLAGRPGDRFVGAGQLATSLRSLPQRRQELEQARAEQAERERLSQQAARRHKLIVAGGAVAAVLLALAAALGYGMRKAQLERDRQRRFAYAAEISLAHQAFKANNLGRARGLLERQRPQPGQTDLRGWEWRYLWQLTRGGALVTLTNRPARGLSVSFSPDGTRLAVGWLDGRVDLWDVPGRRWVKSMAEGDQPSGAHVAFSPVRNVLAATSQSSKVLLHDLDSGQTTLLWQAPESPWNVWDLSFSPDGSKVVIFAGSTPDRGDSAWVINAATAKTESQQACSYSGALDPTSFIGAARITPDNRRLYLANSDLFKRRYTMRCIGLLEGEKSWETEPQQDSGVTALAVSPEGRLVASGSGFEDSNIRIWDATTGRLLEVVRGHTGWVGALLFSKDGKWLVSAASDQTIRFWDVNTWSEMKLLRGHTDEVHGLAISESAQLLASVSRNGDLMLWREREEVVTDGYSCLPESLGTFQLWPLDGSRVCLLPFDQSPELVDFAGSPAPVSIAGIGASSNVLFCSSWTRTNLLCLWDGQKQVLFRELRGLEMRPCGALTLGSSRVPTPWVDYNEKRQLFAWTEGDSSSSVYLMNTTGTGKRVEITSDVTGFYTVWFSRNGDFLAALARGPNPLNLRVWSLDAKKVVASVDGVRDATFAAGERVLAAALNRATGHELRLYDLANPGSEPRVFKGNHFVTSLAESPDGSLVALGTEGGPVRLFDAARREWLEDLHGHLNAAAGIAFSPDGRRLMSTFGAREAVKLWDLTTREELLTLQGKGSLLFGALWSADGNVILAGRPWQAWRAPSWADIDAAEKRTREKTH